MELIEKKWHLFEEILFKEVPCEICCGCKSSEIDLYLNISHSNVGVQVDPGSSRKEIPP